MSVNDKIHDNIKPAVYEAEKFIQESNGLFTNEDMPAFIAGYLACIVRTSKEQEQ